MALIVPIEDVDMDGNLDLLAKVSPTLAFLYLGLGNGTFKTPGAIGASIMDPNGAPTGIVYLADVNGDNVPDLIFSGPSDPSAFPGTTTAVQLFLNDSHGFFLGAGGAAVDVGIDGIVVFDADGDGRPDIVMAASDEVLELLNK